MVESSDILWESKIFTNGITVFQKKKKKPPVARGELPVKLSVQRGIMVTFHTYCWSFTFLNIEFFSRTYLTILNNEKKKNNK